MSKFKYDPEACPDHPPASTLRRLWCRQCGANKGMDLPDPAPTCRICDPYLPDIAGNGSLATAVREYQLAREQMRIAWQRLHEAMRAK